MNGNSIFKAVVAALLLVGGVVYYRHHPGATFAADGIDPAWDAAAQQNPGVSRPTVVLFTAEWCPSCRAMHENVLSRSDVQEELRGHYAFHVVDLTNPSPAANAHAQKCGVQYIPTLIRFNADGKETGRTNYRGAQQLIEWLKAGE
jgi:thiol:disulfide interchange protein DsbD